MLQLLLAPFLGVGSRADALQAPFLLPSSAFPHNLCLWVSAAYLPLCIAGKHLTLLCSLGGGRLATEAGAFRHVPPFVLLSFWVACTRQGELGWGVPSTLRYILPHDAFPDSIVILEGFRLSSTFSLPLTWLPLGITDMARVLGYKEISSQSEDVTVVLFEKGHD